MSEIWELLTFLGSSVCHQLPERSYFLDDVQMPLCARCIGIHVGFLASTVFLLLFGKRLWPSLPDKKEVVVLGAIMSFFLIDAALSYSGLSESSNLRRTLSGLSLGIPLPFVLVPLFRSMLPHSAERDVQGNAPTGWLALAGLYVISAAAILSAEGSWVLFYPVSVLGLLGLFVFFSLAASVILFLLMEKSELSARNKLAAASSAAIVIVLALALAHETFYPNA